MILYNHADSPIQVILYGFRAEGNFDEYCRDFSLRVFPLDEADCGKTLLGRIWDGPYSVHYIARRMILSLNQHIHLMPLLWLHENYIQLQQ